MDVADMHTTNQPAALDLSTASRTLYYGAKRTLDLAVSLALLILLAPVIGLIAIAILVYSPGPILFKQERVGARRVRHGKEWNWEPTVFKCLKFRTMHINADSAVHEAYVRALIENDQAAMAKIQGTETAVRKLVQDKRITRPGKLLRKLSLDELPQLWNVVRGEMSLVGPRPAIPYEVKMYRPWHMQRLLAQPGITGLQQITARSAADFDEQVRLDLEYIEQQSLGMDLAIIIKTPLVILSTRGAE